jgi:hypothetical protein
LIGANWDEALRDEISDAVSRLDDRMALGFVARGGKTVIEPKPRG